MSPLDLATAIALGVGLAAACGLRVFLPLGVASLALQTGWIDVPLSEDFAWVGTPLATVLFGVAALVELFAYMIPWLDHALDTLAAPAALAAGTAATASFLGDLDPMLRWTTAIVAGGGAAGATQVLSVGARATSLVTTGGLGNPVVALLEGFLSLVVSVLAIVIPIVAAVAVVLGLTWLWRRSRRPAAARTPAP